MRINTWTADGLAARETSLATARRRERARVAASRAAAARVLPHDLERPNPELLAALVAALTPPGCACKVLDRPRTAPGGYVTVAECSCA